jgi:hypothetical protein
MGQVVTVEYVHKAVNKARPNAVAVSTSKRIATMDYLCGLIDKVNGIPYYNNYGSAQPVDTVAVAYMVKKIVWYENTGIIGIGYIGVGKSTPDYVETVQTITITAAGYYRFHISGGYTGSDSTLLYWVVTIDSFKATRYSNVYEMYTDKFYLSTGKYTLRIATAVAAGTTNRVYQADMRLQQRFSPV